MPANFPSLCGRKQEMADAIVHCQLGEGEVDGPERAAALKRTFEYIEDKLCGVTLVFGVHEERNSQSYDYPMLLFSNGSHLYQCRTLQVLGLGCCHFWATMLTVSDFGSTSDSVTSTG